MAFAGAGHDHGESAFSGNAAPATHFTLSDIQLQNLDVKTEKASRIPMQQTIDMLAFTELLPEKTATISPRFNGKVLNISVKVGQAVKKGQTLALLDPLNVGNNRVKLTAPIDGFVLHLHAGVGEIVQAGGAIMEVGDDSQMLLRGVAYETPDILKIKVGQRVDAHLDIAPQRRLEGIIQRINRVIDPQTRTFSVYALIDTPKHTIKPGLQATLEVFTGTNQPVLAVPKAAVLGEIGSYFLYIKNGHNIERRPIGIGVKSAQHIQITHGLKGGENVVTQGNYQMQYILTGNAAPHNHTENNENDNAEHEGHNHSQHEQEHGHEPAHSHGHDHSNHAH